MVVELSCASAAWTLPRVAVSGARLSLSCRFHTNEASLCHHCTLSCLLSHLLLHTLSHFCSNTTTSSEVAAAAVQTPA